MAIAAAPAHTRMSEQPSIARLVQWIVIVSGLLIVIVRLLAPFEVGSDQATQIEAAERLARGAGLTTTNVTPDVPDITQPVAPRHVTWWAPGVSIIIGAFLIAGLPLVAALKAASAIATIVGWVGWAVLARNMLPATSSRAMRVLYLVVAAVLPLVTTPSWATSDLYLWAGIPAFVLLLGRSAVEQNWKIDAAAGCLFGALCAIRYASVFLAIAAALILVYTTAPAWKTLFKRAAIFGVCAMLLIGPVAAYVKIKSDTRSAIPPVVAAADDTREQRPEWLTRVKWVLVQLPSSWNVVPGLSLLALGSNKVNSDPLSAIVGLFGFAFTAALAALALRLRFRPVIVAAAIVPLANLIVLCALKDGYFLSVPRYYEPVALAAVLVLVNMTSQVRLSAMRLVARAAVAVFVVYSVTFTSALAVSRSKRPTAVQDTLGYTPARVVTKPSTSVPIRYPNPQIAYSRKEGTRRKIRELHNINPDAMFFVERYGFYAYDEFPGGPTPGVTLRVLSREQYWKTAFSPKAVKVFWAVESDSSIGFVGTANQKLVYEDKYERSRILESDLPAGYRFAQAFRAR